MTVYLYLTQNMQEERSLKRNAKEKNEANNDCMHQLREETKNEAKQRQRLAKRKRDLEEAKAILAKKKRHGRSEDST